MARLLFAATMVILLARLTASGQIYFTYTDISGFYDYQTNYRTPQYLRACPGTAYIHATMMIAEDSSNPSASRRTAYAFSSNGGTTWTTFNQVRVPSRRSGFPSLDILQGIALNAAAIANHNVVSAALQSIVFVDYPIGSGAFSELNAPMLLGSDEPIFPEIAGASDGSIILVSSRAAGLTTHRARSTDLSSWGPWSVVISEFVSDGYVAEANATGRVGIAIGAPFTPLWWLESTDNGATWPSSLTELLPEEIPIGPDTFVITPGIDLVHLNADTLITFGTTQLINGQPSHRFAGIGFYSRRTGFRLAVPRHMVSGAIDTLVKRQVNMYPVGYPSIGVSGSRIAIAFQAFRPETSQAGFNYADIFVTQSSDGGSTWSQPFNLTMTAVLDERYVSVSKWNHPGVLNLVFQEDPQPGASAFGPDGAPLARTRQRFARLGTPLSVDGPKGVPREFVLYQNYPNPFSAKGGYLPAGQAGTSGGNPSTSIKFHIPNLEPQTHVVLKVYDVLGREVATLVNEAKQPGEYTVQFDANNLPSGVYFYRLSSGNFVQTKKMALIR